jgi:NAD-dependent DNA ligase
MYHHCLGIPNVGYTTSVNILKHFNNDFNKFWDVALKMSKQSDETSGGGGGGGGDGGDEYDTSQSSFGDIYGVGDTILTSIANYVKESKNRNNVELLMSELNFKTPANVLSSESSSSSSSTSTTTPATTTTTTTTTPPTTVAGGQLLLTNEVILFTGSISDVRWSELYEATNREEAQAVVMKFGGKVTGIFRERKR